MRGATVGLWRDRFVRFAAGSSGTVVSALAGAIRNKWLALHLEAAGIGILAQAFSAQVWIGTLVGLGLGLPVTRAVGAALGRNDAEAARRAPWTAFTIVAAVALPVSALVILLADPISAFLFGTTAHAVLVRISALGLTGIGVFNVAQGLVAGRSDLRASIAFALIGAGVATLLTLLLVPRFGLPGAGLAAAVLYPAGVAGMLWVHLRRHPEALRPRPARFFDRPEASALARFAGVTLALPAIDLGTLLILRTHVLRSNGATANGLLQAALAVSQQVGALFYAYLLSYALGKVTTAGAAGGAAAVRDYTRRQWTPIVAAAAIVFAGALLGAWPLLHLLYSDRFAGARTMMGYTLVGEFGRVCFQAAALGALAIGGGRLWFRVGLVQPLALAAAYAGFVATGSGPLSLPRAYAVSGAVTFAAGAWMMARAGAGLRARDLAWCAAGFLALLALRPLAG
ncbi:MAG TPA: lipid II flippase MurJ [Candidatus Eisenbacteria bacterium]|nr:lipid II flippase MurJ [Candidatus Eisenbacteria bacterium]